MATSWTESQCATLRSMWADGFAASQIGAELGVTRNAVIGKAHRLELPDRRARSTQPHAHKPRKARLVPRTNGNGSLPPEPPPAPEMNPMSLLDLRMGVCHCPIEGGNGTQLYCGGVTPNVDLEYCAFHHAVMHEAVKTNRSTIVWRSRRR